MKNYTKKKVKNIVVNYSKWNNFKYCWIRFGLTDDKRIGTSILMSPLGDVAAVTDNFGRISIIDLSYGIAVRYYLNGLLV